MKKQWPPLEEADGETEAMADLVENGWSWQWPGWAWIAQSLNAKYGNGRSARECSKKYKSLRKEKAALAAERGE